MNEHIKEYTTPTGKKLYRFQIYLGKNKTTGSSIYVKKRGFKTYEDALNSYNNIQEQIKKGTYQTNTEKRYKVRDLEKMWFKYYKTTVRESTYATTKRIVDNHILPQLGNVYIDSLTVLKCQQAVSTWFKDAPHTYKRYIRYTINILDHGINLELIKDNPMKKVKRPKPKMNTEKFTDYYSKNELQEYLTTCKEHEPLKIYAYFRLLAYTGMRKGESLALTWNDIDFNNNSISINKAQAKGLENRLLVDAPKNKASVRDIPVDNKTIDILKQWQIQQRKEMFKLGFNTASPDQLVFANSNNEMYQPTKPTTWNNKICSKYDLRHIKIHGFRHTHASLLFEAGVPMQDVKDRLGHSNIATTMNIYTHVTKNESRDSADKFASFMNG